MDEKKVVKKYVVEIRYIPNPIVLDIRGELVELMLSEDFTHWKISDNKVEVFGDFGLVFVSHQNLGFVTYDYDHIKNCLSRLDLAIKRIGNFPPVRWGVRIFSFEASENKFSILLSKYKKDLLNYKPNNFSKIDGKLADIGVSYVFKNDNDSYHLSSGPMKKEQASQYFDDSADLSENGIFLDLDIFREKDGFYGADFRRNRIETFINEKFKNGLEIISEFSNKLKNDR